MQILYLTHHFTPDIIAGALRAYRNSNMLAEFGHNLNIITSASGNSLVDEKLFPLHSNCNVQRVSGFHIPYFPDGYGYVKNFVNAGKVLAENSDVIFATSPTISTGIAGYKISQKTSKPFVIEMRDPWLRSTGVKKLQRGGAHINVNSVQGRLFFSIQKKLLAGAKKIVVTNAEIIREIRILHPELNENTFEVVYNSVGDIKKSEGVKFSRPTIFCSGVLYKERGIDVLIKSMQYNADVQLLLAGFAPDEDMRYYEKLIYDLNLIDRVQFLGVIPPEDVTKYQLGADILFAGQTDPKLNYNLPARVFEYMAVGKPVLALAIRNSGLDNLITLHKCGEVTYSNDPVDLARSIGNLSNKTTALALGRAGKRAVKTTFNLRTQTKKLEHALFN
ncbi:MAG: glycosyltransferase family 4 protein [DPANN group archaeon]|nr:glycosyltransferase family 4 protein [DPANN group archaeon]